MFYLDSHLRDENGREDVVGDGEKQSFLEEKIDSQL